MFRAAARTGAARQVFPVTQLSAAVVLDSVCLCASDVAFQTAQYSRPDSLYTAVKHRRSCWRELPDETGKHARGRKGRDRTHREERFRPPTSAYFAISVRYTTVHARTPRSRRRHGRHVRQPRGCARDQGSQAELARVPSARSLRISAAQRVEPCWLLPERLACFVAAIAASVRCSHVAHGALGGVDVGVKQE